MDQLGRVEFQYMVYEVDSSHIQKFAHCYDLSGLCQGGVQIIVITFRGGAGALWSLNTSISI